MSDPLAPFPSSGSSSATQQTSAKQLVLDPQRKRSTRSSSTDTTVNQNNPPVDGDETEDMLGKFTLSQWMESVVESVRQGSYNTLLDAFNARIRIYSAAHLRKATQALLAYRMEQAWPGSTAPAVRLLPSDGKISYPLTSPLAALVIFLE